MAGLGSFFLEIGVDSAALQRGLNNAESRLSTFGQRAEKIGTSLSLAISAPLALVGKNALQTSAQFESLEMSFGTMLRSMENGKTLMKDLQNYNLATSFQFEEVAGAGKSLLAFGFAQQQIIPQMKMIGDISAGVGINIKDLAEIYGKARVQGRLFAEDINQLTGRGIPIIAELAKQFGVSEQAIKKLTEDGKIGFANLEQAFASMTSEGGQFFNMTANQSKTLGGIYSNLQDSITQNLRTIGDSIVKNLDLKTVIPQASKYLTDLAEGFSKLSPEAQKAIVIISGMAIVLPPLLALAGAVLPAMATGFLALISPAGLASIALVAAAALIIKNWDDVNDRIFRAKTNARKALLGIGMVIAGLQGVTNPTVAAEMRAKIFKSFNESMPIDPQAEKLKANALKSYDANRRLMFQKGKSQSVTPPPPPPNFNFTSDAEKKALEKLAEETKQIRSTLINDIQNLEIAAIEDKFKREKAEAQKNYNDDVKAKMDAIGVKKGLDDKYAKYVSARYKSLQTELRQIQRESFVVPQEIKRAMITSVMNSVEPKDKKKVTNDVMQNSLDRSIMLGTKGIQSEQDRGVIGKILGVEIDVTKWQSDSASYINAAQAIEDANDALKDSFKNLAKDLATQMSFIVGEMITGTASMKDLSMMITSVISQELAKIARLNIIAGIGTLITTGNPLKLLGGLAAGVGSGILSGMNKKTASMQTQRVPTQSKTSQLRGGDLYWSQKRYETITGF